jgi:hypothetical protein
MQYIENYPMHGRGLQRTRRWDNKDFMPILSTVLKDSLASVISPVREGLGWPNPARFQELLVILSYFFSLRDLRQPGFPEFALLFWRHLADMGSY